MATQIHHTPSYAKAAKRPSIKPKLGYKPVPVAAQPSVPRTTTRTNSSNTTVDVQAPAWTPLDDWETVSPTNLTGGWTSQLENNQPREPQTFQELMEAQAEHYRDLAGQLLPWWLKTLTALDNEVDAEVLKLEDHFDEYIAERRRTGWYTTTGWDIPGETEPQPAKDPDGWAVVEKKPKLNWEDSTLRTAQKREPWSKKRR